MSGTEEKERKKCGTVQVRNR